MRYYLVTCLNGGADDPKKHYYEVDGEDRVLRAIEDYGDGGFMWDAVAEYGGKQTSLLEMPYSDVQWDESPAPDAEIEEMLMVETSIEAEKFEEIFKSASENGERVEW